jgi:large subunit ribosomal protein L16
MLMPRKVKHRKQHHPGRSGAAKGGTRVTFGDFGIQALEPAYVTNRQIESARIAITRHIRRGGKVWINIFPDRPLTKKPAETRMGSGKGTPEYWVANVKPGRVMFEMSYPNEQTAREALRRAIHELRELGDEELVLRLRESKEELFNLRFQMATGQLDNNRRLRTVRHDIARVYTVMRERELGLSAAPIDDEGAA